MISRSSLCELDSSPSALFELLDLPVSPVEIDVDDWRRCGFDPAVRHPVRLIHAGHLDSIDLLALDGPGASSQAPSLLRSYRRWNRDLLPLVSVLDGHSRSIWTMLGDSPRRLDVDTTSPRADLLERLRSLAAHNRSGERLRERIHRSLAREDVSSRFLRGFREAVRTIEGHVLHSFSLAKNEASSFALRLASRLLFLQFIQIEGWLDHDTDFLRTRVDQAIASGTGAYQTLLRPLFFEALNRPAALRTPSARRLGLIPFLNGGLFRPMNIERRHDEISLPDPLVHSLIHDVFESFTYTIREDDLAGLSIDPEMLGQVFESLMSSDERSASGTFYTPRQIVSRLVSNAIVEWLSDGREDVAGRLLRDQTTPAESRTLYRRLQRISIVDPACGSGAFLLSALQNVEKLSRTLADRAGFKTPRHLRRRIVTRSLFGVDLKSEAVGLCELRLWLAVVGAERGRPAERIPPLPNLDRNIRQGNSLVSPLDMIDASGRHTDAARWRKRIRRRKVLLDRYRAGGAESSSLAEALRRNDRDLTKSILRDLHQRETGRLARARSQRSLSTGSAESDDTRSIEQRIERIARLIRDTDAGDDSFFSWNLQFAEIVERGGFDLVVGNPPWLRSSHVDASVRDAIAARWEGARDSRRFDLSSVFLESALERASPSGVVSMLVPSKILTSGYARPVRRRIFDRHTLTAIDDWSRQRSLFDADVFPVGLTIASTPDRLGPVRIRQNGSSWSLPRERMTQNGRWLTLPTQLLELLDRIAKRHRPLGEVVHRPFFMGAKTGANDRHFLDVARFDGDRAELKDGSSRDLANLAICARGRDVRRWRFEPSTFLDLGNGHPAERPRFVSGPHLGRKVVWKDVATSLECVALPSHRSVRGFRLHVIPNQTLYGIATRTREESLFLAGVLNSSIASFLAIALADQAKDGHFRFYGRTVARIPFPLSPAGSPLRRRLVRAAAEAHRGRTRDDAIEDVVATLYGLTARDVEAIRSWLDR